MYTMKSKVLGCVEEQRGLGMQIQRSMKLATQVDNVVHSVWDCGLPSSEH